MKIKTIILDDEPLNVEILKDDLSRIEAIDVLACFYNPLKALDFLSKQNVDLVFLDIQMPQMLGTDFIRNLKSPPLIVFTTAHLDYAYEGYELNVVDYLLKPIPFNRLELAVNKVFERLGFQNTMVKDSLEGHFFVKSEYKDVKIFYDNILYIEGLKDYVKIFINTQDRPILTRANLKTIMAYLPDKHFVRVHKSYIVGLSKIKNFSSSIVSIKEKEIPIGPFYLESFNRQIEIS
jgi:DNA-binding LytR/AlgR family response regulator